MDFTNVAFRLDHGEYGEFYYGMVAFALKVCPIQRVRELTYESSRSLFLFARDSLYAGSDTLPNLNKGEFRECVCKRLRQDMAGTLQKMREPFKKWREELPVDMPDVPKVAGEKIAFIWNRQRVEPEEQRRNSSDAVLKQLTATACNHGFATVLVGREPLHNIGCDHYLGEFYKRANGHYLNPVQQLAFLEAIVGDRVSRSVSIGMQSGAMDGPALFFGLRTIFLADPTTASNGLSELSECLDTLRWVELPESKEQWQRIPVPAMQAIEGHLDF